MITRSGPEYLSRSKGGTTSQKVTTAACAGVETVANSWVWSLTAARGSGRPAEGIAVQPAVPRPQFVRQIDEIWGVRCACGGCAPLFCSDLTATLARQVRQPGRARRGGPREQARGEDGRVPRARHLRAVREGDGRGLPGTFWFDLDKILATITEDDLKQKLQAFEQAQQETRNEAIAAALQRKAAATAEDG